jgi:hypothetical protein
MLKDSTTRRHFNRLLMRSTGWIAAMAALKGLAWATPKSEAPVPGGPLTAKSRMLDTGADLLQSKKPIDAMSEFLNGFHFYANDMGRQVEANHFCTHLNEDFHQCVIYDSDQKDAKLLGIEYIVSERVFVRLPDDEKKLWHSHNYEVKSGELVAPRIPGAAEHSFMEALVTTYGKTWHCWQIDRDHDFPMGIPQLMMGFTHDGQANQQMVQARDQRFGISSAQEKKDRDDIPMPQVQAGANSWQSGRIVQLILQEVEVKNLRGSA